MKNLILHIPHSSTKIPLKEGYCVSDEILNQEILKLTDWYTDDLFENEIDYSIKAPFRVPLEDSNKLDIYEIHLKILIK
jgi:N-formylglutamate deformylase